MEVSRLNKIFRRYLEHQPLFPVCISARRFSVHDVSLTPPQINRSKGFGTKSTSDPEACFIESRGNFFLENGMVLVMFTKPVALSEISYTFTLQKVAARTTENDDCHCHCDDCQNCENLPDSHSDDECDNQSKCTQYLQRFLKTCHNLSKILKLQFIPSEVRRLKIYVCSKQFYS